MAKFSGMTVRPALGIPTALSTGPTVTHEGGAGFELDAKTQLYTLAVTDMGGETTYYEHGAARLDRLAHLVHAVTATDPEWVQGFVPFLRDTAQMRSASIVVAAEYARAGGPGARQVVNAACSRADEPGEMLGYWLSRHGRKIPMAVKRGIADAAVRLYNERSLIKWDGQSKGVRFADVIDLCHPSPTGWPGQSKLFKHALDRRHGHDSTPETMQELALLGDTYAFDRIEPELRRDHLGLVADTAYTWERLAGWLPGGMDAQAWEAVIPQMGYMALLRNLRNFEEAKVSGAMLDQVAARIADPDEVAKSRQFPYRFLTAYKETGSTRWAWPLEQALEASVRNVPVLPGRTLVLVDTSGSMQSPPSGRSKILMCEIAALFGGVTAARSKATLAIYAQDCAIVDQLPSVLRSVEGIRQMIGAVGHATYTWPSARTLYDGHDRVIVFTDMQDHPDTGGFDPPCPVYVWDLRGYSTANIDPKRGRYVFGGFTDATFRMIPLLEAGRDQEWPWKSTGR